MYNAAGLFDDVNVIAIICAIVVSYMIGNINPSILIGMAHGIDIRKEGSGNAGTTNTLRVLGKKAALATLLIDILKGTFAVVLSGIICGHLAAMLCVAAVFAGHVWPVVFGFKGGKGVATVFGAMSGLNPAMAFICLGIVILFVIITRRMSVGSIAGAVTLPGIAFFTERDFVVIAVVLSLIVLFKHRENIVRLFKGEEPKISFKK